MKYKFLLSIAFIVFSFSSMQAQMRVVIMGSSTAYGVGASVYDSAWVGRLTAYLNRNTADGIDTTLFNIAFPGYDSYQEMPTGFTPPPGRPSPDVDFNVTMAVSLNPDIVIINLPSNDISYGYSKAEFINNLRTMYSVITGEGITCYVTTPQPRNDFDQLQRDSLFHMVDSVNNSFGPYAVDFWNPLVTNDGTRRLRDEYRAVPNPIHLNDVGHGVLFQKILDSYIFGNAGPVALQLTNFQGIVQNGSVLLKWRTQQQDANTSFELEKSSDGIVFNKFSTINVSEPRQQFDYSTADATPFNGQTFYRIKVIERANRIYYSNIINVMIPGKLLSVVRVYADNSNLHVSVNVQKSQEADISIIGSGGNVFSRQKFILHQPAENILIPVGQLANGQYYLRIVAGGETVTQTFIK